MFRRLFLGLGGLVLLASPASAASPPEGLVQPALISSAASSSVLLAATLAGGRLVAVGERGHILLSDDQGRQWRQAKVPVSVTLTMVQFASPRVGWAVGHFGVVLGTQDGGETWEKLLDGTKAAALSAVGAAASGNADAEKRARNLQQDGPDKPFLSLVVFDDQSLMVFGAYGLAYRSEDGGLSWQEQAFALNNPNGFHLNAARASGDVVVVAGEQGLLRRSDDRGRNFRPLTLPYDGSLFDVVLAEDGALVVMGLRGHAYRSEDQGASWTSCASGTEETLTAGTLLAGHGLVMATAGGHLLRGDDRCHQFKSLDVAGVGPLAGVQRVKGDSLVVVGAGGLRLVALPQGDKESGQ